MARAQTVGFAYRNVAPHYPVYVGDYTSSASPPVTTAGSFTVGDSTSTIFAGVVVDAHAGTGAGFTKQGSGTLTLTGNNTLFTAPVAITAGTLAAAGTGTNKALGAITSVAISNGGTLLLGNSDQVNAAATMTLGSATGSGTSQIQRCRIQSGNHLHRRPRRADFDSNGNH